MVHAHCSVRGLQCLLNICGDYAAEREITSNCNKTVGVLFCPKKHKQPASSNDFLSVVHVQRFDQVKYLGGWINASLMDEDGIQRQVKSINVLCSKQTPRHFRSVLSFSKKHCFVPIACQLWSKYTQT